jgi:hypothetical protein
MRCARFFRLDETTSEERASIMTGFVARVRQVLDRAAKPGHKRWLCVRVPLCLCGHDPLGIDLSKWVDVGVDMVNLSAHFIGQQQSDLAIVCRMIPDTAVYLEMTFCSSRHHSMTDEQAYTTAHLVYSRGGSGVSFFNFVYYRRRSNLHSEPPFHIFKHINDPVWLAKQPQHYFLSKWNAPCPNSPLPKSYTLSSDEVSRFDIDMAPLLGGWKTDARLRMQTGTPYDGCQITVRFNGEKFPKRMMYLTRIRIGMMIFIRNLIKSAGGHELPKPCVHGEFRLGC